MTRRPAAGLHAEPSGGQIHLVMEHHDLIEWGLIEFGGGQDRSATFVHIGLGLHQQGANLARRGLDIAFTDLALKLGAPRAKAPAAGHLIDAQKADIVAIALIFRSRIAQTSQDQHGASILNGPAGANRGLNIDTGRAR